MRIQKRSDCKLIAFRTLLFLLVLSILSKPSFSRSGTGDVNNDGSLELADLIISLQVVTGMDPAADLSGYAESGADVNNDGRIGLEESIYILQQSQYRIPQNVTVMARGVEGEGLTLVLNDDEEITILANNTTSFSTKLKSFYNYEVTFQKQPTSPNQGCKISNGTGMIFLEDAVVSVDCSTAGYPVGGTVGGLDGVGLILALEDLSNRGIKSRTIKANGDYVLAGLSDTTEYNVTILSQPTGKSQACNLSNPSGTVSGAAITNLSISCVTPEYFLEITRNGLFSNDSVIIADSESGFIPDLQTTIFGGADGSIVRSTHFGLAEGDNYRFGVVGSSADGFICQLTNPAGVVSDGIVAIDMHCFPGNSKMSSIGGTVSGLGLDSGATSNTITLSLNDGLEYIDVSGTGDTDFIFNIDVYSLDLKFPAF